MNNTMSRRWLALDLMRGLSVIGMLLVVNPGAWEARYSWLNHAEWWGVTAADMIFPSFLLCVGAAMPLVFARRLENGSSRASILAQLLVRSLALVMIGLLLNGFPAFDWNHWRIPGVLQRIGLCYGLVGGLLLWLSSSDDNESLQLDRFWLLVVVLLLALGYWILLDFIPVPGLGTYGYDAYSSWPAYLDRAVFGVNHLWPYGTTDGLVTYDPEGLLSTLPACINVLLGVLLGQSMQRGESDVRLGKWLLAGFWLIVLGVLWGSSFPLIKKIWSSSFAFFSSGVSIVLLVFLSALTRRFQFSWFFYPCAVFGANALLAFMLSSLIGPLLDKPWLPGGVSLRYWGFSQLQRWIVNEQFASFVFSLLVVSLIFLLLNICYKRRWLLKL